MFAARKGFRWKILLSGEKSRDQRVHLLFQKPGEERVFDAIFVSSGGWIQCHHNFINGRTSTLLTSCPTPCTCGHATNLNLETEGRHDRTPWLPGLSLLWEHMCSRVHVIVDTGTCELKIYALEVYDHMFYMGKSDNILWTSFSHAGDQRERIRSSLLIG